MLLVGWISTGWAEVWSTLPYLTTSYGLKRSAPVSSQRCPIVLFKQIWILEKSLCVWVREKHHTYVHHKCRGWVLTGDGTNPKVNQNLGPGVLFWASRVLGKESWSTLSNLRIIKIASERLFCPRKLCMGGKIPRYLQSNVLDDRAEYCFQPPIDKIIFPGGGALPPEHILCQMWSLFIII